MIGCRRISNVELLYSASREGTNQSPLCYSQEQPGSYPRSLKLRCIQLIRSKLFRWKKAREPDQKREYSNEFHQHVEKKSMTMCQVVFLLVLSCAKKNYGISFCKLPEVTA